MIRPQVWIADGSVSGVTPPTSAQALMEADASVSNLCIGAGDFETTVGSPFNAPSAVPLWIDPSSFIAGGSNSDTAGLFTMAYSQGNSGDGDTGTREMQSSLAFFIVTNETPGRVWNFGSGANGGTGVQTASGALVSGEQLENNIATTTLNGTTAGTAEWSMPEQGSGYKKFICDLEGYENTTGTAQTITFSTAFTSAQGPLITSQPSRFGATVSKTTLTLPVNMTGAVTGWIVVEGR